MQSPTKPIHPATRRMQRLGWIINNRVMPRPRRVPDDLIEKSRQLREAGDADAAAAVLDHHENLTNDWSAMICLANAKAALRDISGALELLDAADIVLRRQTWAANINRANFLKNAGRYPEAAVAAQNAIETMPQLPDGYLAALAVSECAGGNTRFARSLVARMDESVPDWRSSALWVDILSDSDYMRIANDARLFMRVFGEAIEPLRERYASEIQFLIDPPQKQVNP